MLEVIFLINKFNSIYFNEKAFFMQIKYLERTRKILMLLNQIGFSSRKVILHKKKIKLPFKLNFMYEDVRMKNSFLPAGNFFFFQQDD